MKTITFTSCPEPWTAIDVTEKIQEQIDPDESGFALIYTPHTSTAVRIGKIQRNFWRITPALHRQCFHAAVHICTIPAFTRAGSSTHFVLLQDSRC